MKELGALREPTGSRTTLKLKTPGRTSQKAPETPLKTRAPVKTTGPVKAAAPAKSTDWADEHKQRMQADMDALGFGTAPNERGQRR
jgi:hypothetical protein